MESALDGLEEHLDGYFQRLKTYLDRYTDDQLETIADFLEGNADLMHAATADLTAEARSTRRSR